MSQTPCVGFSFGNLNTCVGFVESKNFEQYNSNSSLVPSTAVVPNLQGERTTPNFITFGQKEIFVGIPALSKFQAREVEFTKQTIYSFQQLLTQQISLCENQKTEEEVRQSLTNYNFPFKWNIVEKESNKKSKQDSEKTIEIEINWNGELKNLPIIPIISNYFNKIKDIVSAFVDAGEAGPKKDESAASEISAAAPEQAQSIKKIVLAYPVNFFNEPDKQDRLISDLESIFEKLKLDVVEHVPEPIAACVAYGLDKPVCENDVLNKAGIDLRSAKKILVLDIGHSRSTASLVIRDPVKGFLRLEKVNSAEGMAGNAIDDALLEYCFREIQTRHGADVLKEYVKNNDRVIMRLRSAFKEFKTTICAPTAQKAHIACESLYSGMDFALDISKPRFEMTIQSILNKNIQQLLDPLLKESDNYSTPIDVLVLAGGSSNIPKLSQLLDAHFQSVFSKKIPILNSMPCEEVIACGAGIYGFYSKKYRHFFHQQKKNNLELEKPVENGKFLKNPISCRLNGGFVREIFRSGELLPLERKIVFSSLTDSKIGLIELFSSSNSSVIPLVFSKRFEQVEVNFQIDENGALKAEKIEKTEGQTSPLKIFVSKQTNANAISSMPPADAFKVVQTFEQYVCNIFNKLVDKPEKLEKAKPILDEAADWLSKTKDITSAADVTNKHAQTHEKLQAALRAVTKQE